jgi:dihydroflavonol-4-reductase
MRACVTGATGFLGAHLVRLLCQRGDEVKVTYRDRGRMRALEDFKIRQAKADVNDYRALRRAFAGCDVVFHTAGYVGSRPTDLAWRINAEAPLVVVEAAAAAGAQRVVVTSSISAVGLPSGELPADERTVYPEDWLGLTYPDSKHEGERVALEASSRHAVEVVVVNPGYVLGVPLDRSSPREISARTVGNYLRGRLPAVIDAPMNFVDVEDVAAGHILAAEIGQSGERYILGGHNTTWPALIDRVAELSGIHHPVVVLPREVARLARVRDALGLPGPLAAEGYELMAQEWRFSSEKAKQELGYETRSLDETLRATIAWYLDLMGSGAFDGARRSSLALMAAGTQAMGQVGLLLPFKLGERIARRKLIAGA